MKIRAVSKELEAAELWEGCSLQLSLQYNHLTVEMIIERVKELKRCDDLTRREKALLILLEREVELQKAG